MQYIPILINACSIASPLPSPRCLHQCKEATKWNYRWKISTQRGATIL